MSHNRDLSAAAAQIGFHSSNIGIGTDVPDKLLAVSGANTVARFKSSTTYVDLIFQNNTKDNGFIQYNSSGNFNFFADSGSTSTLSITGGAPGNVLCKGKLSVGDLTNPGALLSIPAGESNTPRLAIESAVDDNDFTITQYEDGNGTYTMLGQNVKLNSSGNNTILDSAHRTAAIQLDARNNGNVTFYTGAVNAVAERLRITSDGKFGFNTTNPGAFDSGANHLVLLGNTSGTGNAGITIASGTDSYGNIYFADGTSGADAYRGVIAYNHNGNTMRFATNGSEKVRIAEDGDLGINTLDPQEKLHVHIAKNSGSTSTTRTKQHAAMRLSLNRSGGSAPYYGWGPALDFYSDNYDGSTQRPNARIAGVISNSSVDHEGGQLRFFTTANDTATSETDFTERMRIYADGVVTTPYQPAFMAKLSAATGQNFNGTLIFNSVNHNIGGHYNSSNGRFTAPVAGRYLFNWYTNVDTNSNSTSLWGDWLINGSYSNYRFYTHVTHSGWELLTASIIFNLNTNDFVNVYVSTSGNYDGGSYGSFNGCLLG